MSAQPLPEQPTQVLPALSGRAPRRFATENLLAAVVTVVVAGGLAVLANAGPGQLVLGVAIVQGVLIVAWVFGTDMPGRIGALIIAVLAAVASDAVMSAWPHSQLGPLIGVLGLAVPAMFVHQLARGVVRSRVVESLSAVAVVVVATVALSALIQLRHETDARVASTAIAAAGAALAAGLVIDAVVPGLRFEPEVPRGLGGVIASLVVGGIVGFVRLHGTVEFSTGRAVLLGAALGAIVGLLGVGFSYVTHTLQTSSTPGRVFRPVLAAVLPLAVLAPVAYVLALAIQA
jgi:hypothetical protein